MLVICQLISFLISGVTCDIDTANIKWQVTNTASGTLSVEFDLMPKSCEPTLYELELYINESVANAEECGENTSFTLLHSSRSMEILTDNAKCNRKVSPCGKVCFHLIVDDGCFKQTLFLMYLDVHIYTCKHEFIQSIVLVMSIKNCSFQVICTSTNLHVLAYTQSC